MKEVKLNRIVSAYLMHVSRYLLMEQISDKLNKYLINWINDPNTSTMDACTLSCKVKKRKLGYDLLKKKKYSNFNVLFFNSCIYSFLS